MENKGEVNLKKIFCMMGICFLAGLSACTNPAGEVSRGTEENFSAGITDENVDKGNESEGLYTENSDSGEADVQSSKTPKVLIDINGYCPDDEKTVFFVGNEEPGSFRIINTDTREEVYKGAMIATSEQGGNGEVLLKGDFSSLKEEGSYYIEAPHIGRSYTFRIKEDHFDGVYDKLEKAVWEETARSEGVFLYRVQALSWMLNYYEYYEEKEEAALSGEMPDFLKKAEELGETLLEEKPQEMDQKELAFYCAAMAQLYEQVKEYDAREAGKFLKEAENAYKLLEGRRYEEDLDEVWLFYDSAVLYKATGYTRYHNVVKNYLKQQDRRDFFEEDAEEEQLLADEAYVHGAVAYLSTVFSVDIDLCSALMEELADKAESIEEERGGNVFLCASKDQRNRLLADRLYVVAIVEHVVVSKEYVQTLEDGIHYINGCNATGSSFLSEKGVLDKTKDEKGSDAVIGSAYLFVLGEIMESEAVE